MNAMGKCTLNTLVCRLHRYSRILADMMLRWVIEEVNRSRALARKIRAQRPHHLRRRTLNMISVSRVQEADLSRELEPGEPRPYHAR